MTSTKPLSRADIPALLALALHAAASDAVPDAVRGRAIRRVLEDLSGDFTDAQWLQRTETLTVAQATAHTAAAGRSQLAFAIAVCVCNADRLRRDAETLFLADLGGRLALTQPQIVGAAALADAIATAPGPDRQTQTALDRAALTRLIRSAALRAARLQALRQPSAILAIGVIQANVLYALGAHFGQRLDAAGVRALNLALGLDPVVEYLRNLGTGLLRDATAVVPGAAAAGIPSAAFCTTFALGHAVLRAYAGGWSQDALRLRANFDRLRALACRLAVSRLPARLLPESGGPTGPTEWQAGNARLCIDRATGRVELQFGTSGIALNANAA